MITALMMLEMICGIAFTIAAMIVRQRCHQRGQELDPRLNDLRDSLNQEA